MQVVEVWHYNIQSVIITAANAANRFPDRCLPTCVHSTKASKSCGDTQIGMSSASPPSGPSPPCLGGLVSVFFAAWAHFAFFICAVHLEWLASTSLLLLQVIAVIIKLSNLASDCYTDPAYRCPVLLPPTHPTGHTQGVYHLVQSLCWKSVQAQHLSHAGGRNPCR